METLVLRDHQVVLEDPLSEVLSIQKILEFLEVDGILGRLDLECIDQCLQLMMSVDTAFLNVVEELMLEQVSTVLAVKGLKSTACPGGGTVLGGLGGNRGHELLSGD